MRKFARFVLLSGALFMLAACAAKPVSPLLGSYTPAPAPDSGHALVYIHYPDQVVARVFPVTVFFDSQEIVAMASGTYTRIYIAPGRHTAKSHWCSKWENGYCPGDLLADFEFKANKTYYLTINFTGRETSFMTFVGYAPVQSGGYEDISVSYDLLAENKTIAYAKQARPNKEYLEE